MTRNELLRRFPNAKESFIKLNLGVTIAPESPRKHLESEKVAVGGSENKTSYKSNEDHRISPGPVPEQAVCNESLAADQGKEENTGRVSVRITAFKARLIDPDNLCAKFFTDALRYSGLIRGDSWKDIEYTIRQVKCAKGQDRTEIEILPLKEVM